MKYVEIIKPSHTVGLQIVKICCLYHFNITRRLKIYYTHVGNRKSNKNMHQPKMNIGISLSRLPSGRDFFVRLHY